MIALFDRRIFLGTALASVLPLPVAANAREQTMYGLIGKFKAVAGKRDELIAILLADTGAMPGCLSYTVAEDAADADGIWITEVWTDKAAHRASLELPSVQAAIAKGRPLIASFEAHHEVRPVGGMGLARQ